MLPSTEDSMGVEDDQLAYDVESEASEGGWSPVYDAARDQHQGTSTGDYEKPKTAVTVIRRLSKVLIAKSYNNTKGSKYLLIF